MSEKEVMVISSGDVATVADKVFADVIPGGGEAPLFPCPKCGRETKVHHDYVVYDEVRKKKVLQREPQRICSMPQCRHVVRGEEEIEVIEARGKAMQPVIVPCTKCGKTTKQHHPDPETEEPRRICAVPTCRNIQLEE